MEFEIKKVNVSELKTNLEYRKISEKNKEKLKKSLKKLGDVGIIVIDEDNNVLSGNMRVSCLKEIYDNNFDVIVKQYKNLSEDEKKQIVFKNNLNYGAWNYIYDFFDIIRDEGIKDLLNIDIKLIKDEDKAIDKILDDKLTMSNVNVKSIKIKEITCPFCLNKISLEE